MQILLEVKADLTVYRNTLTTLSRYQKSCCSLYHNSLKQNQQIPQINKTQNIFSSILLHKKVDCPLEIFHKVQPHPV